jgi:hypothetical protein
MFPYRQVTKDEIQIAGLQHDVCIVKQNLCAFADYADQFASHNFISVSQIIRSVALYSQTEGLFMFHFVQDSALAVS